MKAKKIIAAICGVVLLIGLSACTSTTSTEEKDDATTSETAKPPINSIATAGKSLKEVKKELKDAGYKSSDYDIKSDSGKHVLAASNWTVVSVSDGDKPVITVTKNSDDDADDADDDAEDKNTDTNTDSDDQNDDQDDDQPQSSTPASTEPDYGKAVQVCDEAAKAQLWPGRPFKSDAVLGKQKWMQSLEEGQWLARYNVQVGAGEQKLAVNCLVNTTTNPYSVITVSQGEWA